MNLHEIAQKYLDQLIPEFDYYDVISWVELKHYDLTSAQRYELSDIVRDKSEVSVLVEHRKVQKLQEAVAYLSGYSGISVDELAKLIPGFHPTDLV